MASSKFVEILDDNLANPVAQQHHMSDSDVKLEDVLADHEATIQQHQRSRSSTQSSSTPSRKSHEFNPTTLSGTGSNGSSDDPRLSDTTESQGSPSSTTNSSPTSPVPRIKRLRKFTLTGGFGR